MTPEESMDQQPRFQLALTGWVAFMSGIIVAGFPLMGQAQIAGDGTLGTQVNGVAIVPCTGACTITNGSTRGSNLFHSFRQFSLPNSTDSARFQTMPTIQNVIVRVTGVGQPFVSTINGIIATSNPANVFFLNPNGIVLGPGATLNIGGSFLASTASRMQFADGTELRTSDPTPLLTIRAPIGLQFGPTPGTIQSTGTRLFAGRTDSFSDIALVGGNLTLDNSVIFALGQRVDLGSIAAAGAIGLNLQGNRLSLRAPAGVPRSDVRVTNGSILNVAAAGGGEIAITARHLNLSASVLNAGIGAGLDARGQQPSHITLNATGAVTVAGSFIQNNIGRGAIGQGGNVVIKAKSFALTDGSFLSNTTLGQGNAGQVSIQAQDAVSFADGSTLFNTVESRAIGNSGGVTIQTGTLTMTKGAEIQASTSGRGNAGNVTIQARDRVAFDGVDADDFASGIFSTVRPGAVGNGGNIAITTGSLALTNGGRIQTNIRDRGNAGNVTVRASGDVLIDGVGTTDPSSIATTVGTGGIGSGGNIDITAKSLFVTNGGSVNANTFGQGRGGNIRVQAADQVVLDGVSPTRPFVSSISSEVGFDRSAGLGNGGNISVITRSLSIARGAGLSTATRAQGNAGNISVQARGSIVMAGSSSNGISSQLTSEVSPGAIGNGGTINLTAESILLRDGSQISSSSKGNGSAGNIASDARLITLDQQSRMTTETASGNGGNIDLQVRDLLLLRHGSLISTTAGTAQAGGDGGNITINASRGFVVGAPLENSDITANAFSGRGGRILINAQGIFWLVPRSRSELERLLGGPPLDPQRLPTNDITASSQFGLSGSVTLNILNVDPSRGLVTLPSSLSDPSQQIAPACHSNRGTSSGHFIATGRGGIPLSPEEPLEPRTYSQAWVPLPAETQEGTTGDPAITPAPQQFSGPPNSEPIVEAQGWSVQADGTVELVAMTPTRDRSHELPQGASHFCSPPDGKQATP